MNGRLSSVQVCLGNRWQRPSREDPTMQFKRRPLRVLLVPSSVCLLLFLFFVHFLFCLLRKLNITTQVSMGVVLLCQFWKKPDPCDVSMSWKQNHYLQRFPEEAYCKAEEAHLAEMCSAALLSAHLRHQMCLLCVKTCLSPSVLALSSLVSNAHQLDFLCKSRCHVSSQLWSCHGGACLKRSKYSTGQSHESTVAKWC